MRISITGISIQKFTLDNIILSSLTQPVNLAIEVNGDVFQY
ncbi:MAG: hypothetical protein ABIS74_04900 [Ferruginibacter sp.]